MDENSGVFKSGSLFYKHHVTEAPREEVYSIHTHNTYELIYFVDGDASHVIENKRYKLRRGDLMIVRPLKYHILKIDSPKDYERYDILFDEADIGMSPELLVPEGTEVVNLSKNRIAEGVFKRLDYYNEVLPREKFGEMLRLLIKELLINVSVEREAREEDFSVGNGTVSEALRIINENLFTISGVGEVASRLFVSESYLFRAFKKELCATPKKYINDKRLLAAQRFIKMGDSSIVAAEKCGYRDYTAFYRAYVKFFGNTPSFDGQRVLKDGQREG